MHPNQILKKNRFSVVSGEMGEIQANIAVTYIIGYTSVFLSYSLVGLPTVPYFPGHPVFRPMCPASRLMPPRDAKCPVFWYAHETSLRCW